jgi:ethanolamine utilization protein EutN
MILGKVIGQVWATRMAPSLGDHKLLLVKVLKAGPEPTETVAEGSVIVAKDLIGAGPGELVTVSLGSGARNVLSPGDNRGVLCDAAISRIVDGQDGTDSVKGRL